MTAMQRILPCLCGWLTVFALASAAADGAGKVTITVRDKETGQPVPCRVHLRDPAGKPVKADGLPFFFDHFVCPGTLRLDLPSGKYGYEIERGPEWSRAAGTLTVSDGVGDVKEELRRVADLAKEGWYCGDLHVHRPIADIELLMRAEDLHIAPVITWWNSRNQWDGQKRLPEEPLTRFDGDRYYHALAGEDERTGGALLYFNLSKPLPITGAEKEFPSPLKFVAEARAGGRTAAWIDVEKPFWWDVPAWLASGQVDSIGIANNHMCRSEIRDQEAWGKPRDRTRLPPPTGNGLWSQEIYYHILNSGLRLPPSAGSASGVLPNPVGYNRAYVHVDGPLTYPKWWEALRAGRVFVTNGPLLRVRADGKLPGQVFTAPAGKEIDLEIKADLITRDPVRSFEIIKNGKVDRTVSHEEWARTGTLGKVRFQESGWFLVRAIAENPQTFRFASTGPYYVEVGEAKHRISKASAQFFLDWVEERTARIKLDDPTKQQEVLRYHAEARKFWEGVRAKANVD